MRVLTKGLLKLGLLRGTLAKALKAKSLQPLLHAGPAIGWVWTCTMSAIQGRWALAPAPKSMVLTVEPGLYIPRAKGIAKEMAREYRYSHRG